MIIMCMKCVMCTHTLSLSVCVIRVYFFLSGHSACVSLFACVCDGENVCLSDSVCLSAIACEPVCGVV